MRARAKIGLGLLVVLSSSARASSADADELSREELRACVDGHVESQILQRENRLIQARSALASCARDRCPGPIARDCVKRLNEAQAAQPNAVVAAVDGCGKPARITEVFVDGERVRGVYSGEAIDVDPGEHSLRVVTPGESTPPVRVVFLAGERNRRVDFAANRASETRCGELAPSARLEKDRTSPSSSIPVPSYVLGGVGVVGLAGFAVLGLSAYSDEMDYQRTCAPYCSRELSESVARRYLIADVSLAVGVLALAGAAIFAWPALTGK